jgi:hypothetical protein
MGMDFIIVFGVALVGYSIAVLAHKFLRELRWWMIGTFGVALAFDTAGTYFLCYKVAEGVTFSAHTILGFVILIIMALHFAWALTAMWSPRFRYYFDKGSIWAWGVWLFVFFSPLIPITMKAII